MGGAEGGGGKRGGSAVGLRWFPRPARSGAFRARRLVMRVMAAQVLPTVRRPPRRDPPRRLHRAELQADVLGQPRQRRGHRPLWVHRPLTAPVPQRLDLQGAVPDRTWVDPVRAMHAVHAAVQSLAVLNDAPPPPSSWTPGTASRRPRPRHPAQIAASGPRLLRRRPARRHGVRHGPRRGPGAPGRTDRGPPPGLCGMNPLTGLQQRRTVDRTRPHLASDLLPPCWSGKRSTRASAC